MGITPKQINITEGVSNNNTVPTLGKVEDMIGGAGANGVFDLTFDEVTQLGNIDTITISNVQWSYVGAMNQALATTDSPVFVGETLSGLSVVGGIVQTDGSGVLSSSVTLPPTTLATILTSTTDFKIGSSVATGKTIITDENGDPVFSYDNTLNKFTFTDNLEVTIGGAIKVNAINTYNAVTGVTIEGVQLLSGAIKANSISELTGSAGVNIESINVTGTVITMTDNNNDYVINCTRSIAGDGKDFIVNAANAVYAGGSPENGGNIILSPGSPASGGQNGSVVIGKGLADVDYVLMFDGQSNDGQIKWWEDEAYFDFDHYIAQPGVFAEIYVADASTAQSIPTGATYTKSTAFTTDGQSANCTAAAASDKITITKVGQYRTHASVSAISGTANVLWRCAAFLNGVEQDQCHWKRKMATSTDAGTMSFDGIIDVTSVPLDLDLRLRHDQGGSIDFTIEYANLNVEYMGAT